MRIGKFDLQKETLVVAEVGNNHEGSYTLAEELIGLAHEAGAGAVKFQTFLPEQFVSPRDAARIERLRKFQLSFAQFEKLKAHAERAGILFFSTPLDLESARFLGKILSVIKVASGDNNLFPLLREVAAAKIPVILSTGMATLAEAERSKNVIEAEWKRIGHNGALAALHCISLYPAKPEQVGLENIRSLKARLGCTVGYSDHTLGIELAALSVLCGARIVEKHFTINKNHSDFRDHQLSADPADLRELVSRVRHFESLLGDGAKSIGADEKEMARLVRRSMVAAKDIAAGTALGAESVHWIRAGGGVAPEDEDRAWGKRLRRDVKAGEPISLDNLG